MPDILYHFRVKANNQLSIHQIGERLIDLFGACVQSKALDLSSTTRLIHGDDEAVDIESLRKSSEFYFRVAQTFLSH